jgi:hypothetical protein
MHLFLEAFPNERWLQFGVRWQTFRFADARRLVELVHSFVASIVIELYIACDRPIQCAVLRSGRWALAN